MPDLLLLFDDKMIAHNPGHGHPERPERLRAIVNEMSTLPSSQVRWAAPGPAPASALTRVHEAAYVQHIESVRGQATRLDPDTALSTASVDAALLAAGAALAAVDAVHANPATRPFALVRPPGHHAEADRAMGFCVFNNIAIAAAHARDELGYRRILILDWDVHHGNGTQHAFEECPHVLVFNTHRYPFYPGTGAATETGRLGGAGYTVNVPLPPAMGDADYAAIFDELLVPITDQFEPDLVLVSAGFDSHIDDPLGGMNVTDQGFAHLCQVACDIADRHAGGRIALFLEGGYDVDALARSVRACCEVLVGERLAPPKGEASAHVAVAIEVVKAVQGAYWEL